MVHSEPVSNPCWFILKRKEEDVTSKKHKSVHYPPKPLCEVCHKREATHGTFCQPCHAVLEALGLSERKETGND